MIFRITNSKTNDSFVIKGEDIKSIQTKCKKEMDKRGWQEEDCWSKEQGE